MADPLLAIIPGSRPAKNLNRFKDLDRNISQVRKEFVGKPEVCHHLAKHIILIRRGVELEKNTKIFYDIINQYLPVLLVHSDIRWLISICDTIVDIGEPQSAAAAMCVVITVNNLNIQETLLDVVNDGNLNSSKLARNSKNKRATWDGMIALDLYRGDTIYNMQTRMNKIVSECPQVLMIWNEIKQRLVKIPDLTVNQMCAVHKDPKMKRFFI